MAYDTVKNVIATRLNSSGITESSQAVDFKNAPSNEYANRYILKCLTGENQNNTIIDSFYDQQEWEIQVAFARSEQNDIISLDAVHRAKDIIIKDLDNPAHWENSVKMLKYKKWEVTETPNYYVLSIKLDIWDIYTY
jgi:hypothetical protein